MEYSAKVQTFRLFKHEIHRMFVIPHSDEEKNILEQLFRIQEEAKERQFDLMFVRAEQVRVAI